MISIGPHCLYAMHKLWSIAIDVAGSMVCMFGHTVSCAKTG